MMEGSIIHDLEVFIIQDGRFNDTEWKVLLYMMEVSIIQDGRFYDTGWKVL